MSNLVIIQGSSRSVGETKKSIEQIFDSQHPIVDLKTLDISGYDYEHNNQNDDYLTLIEKLVSYEIIVLATPVYWYTMSSIMKIFIDRLNDLLGIRYD